MRHTQNKTYLTKKTYQF